MLYERSEGSSLTQGEIEFVRKVRKKIEKTKISVLETKFCKQFGEKIRKRILKKSLEENLKTNLGKKNFGKQFWKKIITKQKY